MPNNAKAGITKGRMFILFKALGKVLYVQAERDSNAITAVYKK